MAGYTKMPLEYGAKLGELEKEPMEYGSKLGAMEKMPAEIEMSAKDIEKAKEALVGRSRSGMTDKDIKSSKDRMVDRPGALKKEDFEKMKKQFKSGGKVSSASKRADGCAIKGKTRGRMV